MCHESIQVDTSAQSMLGKSGAVPRGMCLTENLLLLNEVSEI
jgi:hypothetical protein